ncbi:MAG TPA: squalene/phytoene synthase family protein [Acidimicrobiales bacterium]|nr:squalene/phytoene synthase family protein [Acidimicrobiales bacterium]
MNAADAFAACEEITRREAKNFAYGIRLLHPPERQALSAVYALARRIDDIGDGDGAPARKLDDLARVRKDLADLPADADDNTEDAVLVAIAAVDRRYDLPMGAFDELIVGCEMDVTGTAYTTIDDLVAYCRLVAGSIGRLSLAVFGTADRHAAAPIADDLGVALQLTNILRDIVEDRGRGRVYLPADDARAVGCPPDLDGDPAAVARLVAFEAQRAREWFDRGLRLLPLLDHRSRACVGAMAGIYSRLLRRIQLDPAATTRGRISVPTWEKLTVAGQSLITGHGLIGGAR